MAQMIYLEHNGFAIEFQSENTSYGRIHFYCDGKEVHSAFESLDIVANKLLKYLNDMRGIEVGLYKNEALCSIFNMENPHCTLYGLLKGGKFKFYLQDNDLNFIAIHEISNDAAISWIDKLKAYLYD